MNAAMWLKKMLNDPQIKNPCPVSAIISSGKAAGFTRKELKMARKEIGAQSISVNGVQHWWLINA